MNKVMVCDPATKRPFESFVAETTTYVCLPESTEYQLSVQATQPGWLAIESSGEEIFDCPVNQIQRYLNLRPVLTAPRALRTATCGLGYARRQRLHEFTAVIKHGTGLGAIVTATFTFELLAPTAYKQAYTGHLKGKPGPEKLTLPLQQIIVDWPEEQKCKHCHKLLQSGESRCRQCSSGRKAAGQQQAS